MLDELCNRLPDQVYTRISNEIQEESRIAREAMEYCQKQTGMSLCDYSRQLREEQEQEQGFAPEMKM